MNIFNAHLHSGKGHNREQYLLCITSACHKSVTMLTHNVAKVQSTADIVPYTK